MRITVHIGYSLLVIVGLASALKSACAAECLPNCTDEDCVEDECDGQCSETLDDFGLYKVTVQGVCEWDGQCACQWSDEAFLRGFRLEGPLVSVEGVQLTGTQFHYVCTNEAERELDFSLETLCYYKAEEEPRPYLDVRAWALLDPDVRLVITLSENREISFARDESTFAWPGTISQGRPPIHISYLIERSRSTDTYRLSIAREFALHLREVKAYARPGDTISYVLSGSTVAPQAWDVLRTSDIERDLAYRLSRPSGSRHELGRDLVDLFEKRPDGISDGRWPSVDGNQVTGPRESGTLFVAAVAGSTAPECANGACEVAGRELAANEPTRWWDFVNVFRSQTSNVSIQAIIESIVAVPSVDGLKCRLDGAVNGLLDEMPECVSDGRVQVRSAGPKTLQVHPLDEKVAIRTTWPSGTEPGFRLLAPDGRPVIVDGVVQRDSATIRTSVTKSGGPLQMPGTRTVILERPVCAESKRAIATGCRWAGTWRLVPTGRRRAKVDFGRSTPRLELALSASHGLHFAGQPVKIELEARMNGKPMKTLSGTTVEVWGTQESLPNALSRTKAPPGWKRKPGSTPRDKAMAIEQKRRPAFLALERAARLRRHEIVTLRQTRPGVYTGHFVPRHDGDYDLRAVVDEEVLGHQLSRRLTRRVSAIVKPDPAATVKTVRREPARCVQTPDVSLSTCIDVTITPQDGRGHLLGLGQRQLFKAGKRTHIHQVTDHLDGRYTLRLSTTSTEAINLSIAGTRVVIRQPVHDGVKVPLTPPPIIAPSPKPHLEP